MPSSTRRCCRDVPFADLLELNGAVRFSDYSTSGSTTTFKGGVNWKPIRDLRLRGSYAEGFRAPSIGELFGTPSRFDQTLNDPARNDSTAPRTSTTMPTVRANCIARGRSGGRQLRSRPTRRFRCSSAATRILTPETSKSWVFGGVYSPSLLPRFSIEAN